MTAKAQVGGRGHHASRSLPNRFVWAWRRRLDSGDVAKIHDVAKTEKVTDGFVSRIMRLAYLSQDVMERLLVWREPPAVPVNDLIAATYLPWGAQAQHVFGD